MRSCLVSEACTAVLAHHFDSCVCGRFLCEFRTIRGCSCWLLHRKEETGNKRSQKFCNTYNSPPSFHFTPKYTLIFHFSHSFFLVLTSQILITHISQNSILAVNTFVQFVLSSTSSFFLCFLSSFLYLLFGFPEVRVALRKKEKSKGSALRESRKKCVTLHVEYA